MVDIGFSYALLQCGPCDVVGSEYLWILHDPLDEVFTLLGESEWLTHGSRVAIADSA
jgi:hypothetical protein